MALPISKRIFKLQRIFCRYFRHSASLNLDSVRVRFAPSPTGELHLGSLRTALYNYLFAKSHGGTFILRIEDTDQTRMVPGATDKLSEVLDWAGLTPDEGPVQGGDYGPYCQNKTAYRCFCSQTRLDLMRKDSLRRGEIPKYDGRCRHLSEDEINSKLEKKQPYVVRFKLETIDEAIDDMVFGPTKHNVADIEGDPVLMKTDSFPTYHFANVVDDHLMKITNVLRGVEWLVSTPKHILLFKAFGWDPPKYAHIPLILGKGGKKLSKRQGDVQIQYYRDHWYEPEAVLNYITLVGGGFNYDEEIQVRGLQDLVNKFSVGALSKNPGQLQRDNLEKLNRLHLQKMLNTDEKHELIKKTRKIIEQYLKDRATQDDTADVASKKHSDAVCNQNETSTFKNEDLSDDFIFKILKWCIDEDRISRIGQIVEKNFQYIWTIPQNLDLQVMKDLNLNVPFVLQHCIEYLKDCSSQSFNQTDLNEFLRNFATEKEINFAQLMSLLRYVICGQKSGPGVAEMMVAVGKTKTMTRLKHSLRLYNE